MLYQLPQTHINVTPHILYTLQLYKVQHSFLPQISQKRLVHNSRNKQQTAIIKVQCSIVSK